MLLDGGWDIIVCSIVWSDDVGERQEEEEHGNTSLHEDRINSRDKSYEIR